MMLCAQSNSEWRRKTEILYTLHTNTHTVTVVFAASLRLCASVWFQHIASMLENCIYILSPSLLPVGTIGSRNIHSGQKQEQTLLVC